VNAICPGFIQTNIFSTGMGVPEDKRDLVNGMIGEAAKDAQPVARGGRPEDIAGTVAFLASDDAAFITGTHILVDGGLLIGPRHSWDPEAPGMFDAIRSLIDVPA
jgi:NAD(P)-dependent dehydrogenase (short-subunit alcohol dehydrogenase family)